ncbi:MAG: ribosome biogenesis GTPase YlqF [Selenomonadaceae bacterium]|nr:ribosome biogenesis GTPase YlqF [Selenomonadaceae bacterium]
MNETLQWFPGHMKKAERLITENLKLVDLVIELLDARIPLSSQNPMLREIIRNKPRLIALGKSDLAAKNLTDAWLKKFRAEEITAVAVDAVKGTGIKNLVAAAKSLTESKTHKLAKYGAKPRSARVMIVGIPNVGKSSLINRLAGMNHVKIENRPGVTRAKQWIKIADGLDLLDMPGILWPKFDDEDVALKLAWTYAISDEVHDLEFSTCKLLETLAEKFPTGLCERYKLDTPPIADGHELLNQIGNKRGCIRKGGVLDVDKTLRLVLGDFRAGKLGRVTLDEI